MASLALAFLASLELSEEACAKLQALGVVEPADLDVLKDEDLKSRAGLSHAQVAKLRAARACAGKPVAEEPVQPPASRTNTRLRRLQSKFWSAQTRGRPKRLIFIRHGESEANRMRRITEVVPDHDLHLTTHGRAQAIDAGRRLRELVGEESVKFIVSPYVRTQETLNGILHAWQDLPSNTYSVREDVRIREQEYGNFDCEHIKEHHKEQKLFGPLFYRYPNGESGADCYDRASLFVETLYRAWQDNEYQNEVIVGHGMMLIVTLMRFLRIPVEEFDTFDRLLNTEFIVLERPELDAKFHISFVWPPDEEKDFRGLRRKPPPALHTSDLLCLDAASTRMLGYEARRPPRQEVWDGTPDAPLLRSVARRATVAGA